MIKSGNKKYLLFRIFIAILKSLLKIFISIVNYNKIAHEVYLSLY